MKVSELTDHMILGCRFVKGPFCPTKRAFVYRNSKVYITRSRDLLIDSSSSSWSDMRQLVTFLIKKNGTNVNFFKFDSEESLKQWMYEN